MKLEQIADVDLARAMPEFTLERVPTASDPGDGSMPEKRFDVFIRFRQFGDVRLDEAIESGPSSGKFFPKGAEYRGGLTDLAGIKAGWIKNSPDLFCAAWLVEPDARGNSNLFLHGFVILQLEGSSANVLLRGQNNLTAKIRGVVMEGETSDSRFLFDPASGRLVESVNRYYEVEQTRPSSLARPVTDVDRKTFYVACIHETVAIAYAIEGGKLVPRSARLVYTARKDDELSEVARFYLGLLAPREALLKANAELAAKHGDTHPGALIYMDEGKEVTIPIPEDWLLRKYSHGLWNSNSQFPSLPGPAQQ